MPATHVSVFFSGRGYLMGFFKWFANAVVTVPVLSAVAYGAFMAFGTSVDVIELLWLSPTPDRLSIAELLFFAVVEVIGLAIAVTSVIWALVAFFTGEGLLVERYTPGLYWCCDGVRGVHFSRTTLLWRWSEEARSLR